MNRFLQETMREFAGLNQSRTPKLLRPVLLAVAVSLFALTGFGFLTTGMYIALSAALGAALAALLIGVGFTIFAGCMLLLTFRRSLKPNVDHASKSSPEESGPNILSLAAFTAAYVLGRRFAGSDDG
ncbi:hypothetical protein [Planktotalea arctica]|uniref:hypothetical protein n=2 Tax=Planktotalea arctica TaxID=1481893 RepID=UPI003219073B